MLVTSPVMEGSDTGTPDTSMEIHDTSNRRKSGRARTKPVLLSQDPNVMQTGRAGSAKRKRARPQDLEGGDEEDDEDDDEDSEDGESSPDEEELKERRKRAAKKRAPKPASKKPKTSDSGITTLPVRPAVNGLKKVAKSQKVVNRKTAVAISENDGLFGGLSHLRDRIYLG